MTVGENLARRAAARALTISPERKFIITSTELLVEGGQRTVELLMTARSMPEDDKVYGITAIELRVYSESDVTAEETTLP